MQQNVNDTRETGEEKHEDLKVVDASETPNKGINDAESKVMAAVFAASARSPIRPIIAVNIVKLPRSSKD